MMIVWKFNEDTTEFDRVLPAEIEADPEGVFVTREDFEAAVKSKKARPASRTEPSTTPPYCTPSIGWQITQCWEPSLLQKS
jgi:hypothetical protein